MKKSRFAMIAGMLYLLLPVCIFAVGWLRWYYAAAVLLALFVGFGLAVRATSYIWRPTRWCARDVVKGSVALALICAVTVFSGVGGHVWQTGDQTYRNEIFRILVEFPWPVVRNGTALIYYIGFWLPAALVGKLFGLSAGFAFQMLWMVLGLMLLFYFLCAWRKRIVLWPLIVFLFFSGFDVITNCVLFGHLSFWEIVEGNAMLGFGFDQWTANMPYPSLLTNFFWSFQQAVPVYVLVMLLLLQKDCKNYAFLGATCLLSATLAVVGMVPIALTMAASRPADHDPVDRRRLSGKAAWLGACKDACSLQNLLVGGCMALLAWLYLSANRSGGIVGLSRFMLADVQLGLVSWIAIVMIEFGVYVLLVAGMQKYNALLAVVFICLAASPWVQVGISCDFCMRVSMAALPFLALIVMDTLVRAKRKKKWVLFAALILALCVGAMTPLSEIYRTVYQTDWSERYEMIYVREDQIFTEPNFNGPAHGNIFFDKLAKPQKE